MTDQAPAQSESEQREQRADPVRAQYVINITPEQYESHLKQAAAKDAPGRLQMEMGGSGTAKASFQNAAEDDVEITSAEWSATGPIVVTPDDEDPTSAKLTPTGLGPATVTVNAQTDHGSAQTSTDVMVIEKIGAPVGGTIEITVEPAPEGAGVPAGSAGQILPVPAPAPDRDVQNKVPPAQVLAQPTPQPQPQSESQPQPE